MHTTTLRALKPRPVPLLHLHPFSSTSSSLRSKRPTASSGAWSNLAGAVSAASPSRPPTPPSPRQHRPVHKPTPHLAADKQHRLLFQTRTRWISRTLAAGHPIPRDLLYRLLDSRDLPPAHLALWVDVLAKGDPIYALTRLGLLESAQADAQEGAVQPPCPTWLFLSLPAMVTDPSHVPYLASQLFAPRFAELAEGERAVFVARCVEHFLKVRHYVALREIVEWVAYTPSSSRSDTSFPVFRRPHPQATAVIGLFSSRSFSRILSALASERVVACRAASTSIDVLRPRVDLLLATMTSRSIPRTLETFLPLFSPKLIPREPEEAMRLLWEMREAGHEPKSEVLHAVVRVCAMKGDSKGVEQLRKDIEAVRRGRKAKLLPVEGTASAASTTPLYLQAEAPPTALGAEEESWLGEEQTETEKIPSPMKRLKHLRLKTHDGMVAADVAGREMRMPEYARALLGDEEAEKKEPKRDEEREEVTLLPPSPPSASSSQSTSPFIYDTTRLLDPAVSLVYYHTLLDFLHDTGRAAAFPPPPFPFDSIAWVSFFGVLGRQPDISATSILSLLRCIETVSSAPASSSPLTSPPYIPPKPTLRLYTAVLRALLLRHAHKPALYLWRSLESRGWRPDAPLLDCVVRAFCGIRRDGLARRTLQFYCHRAEVDPLEKLVSLRATNPNSAVGPQRQSVRLDAVPVNSLLAHLVRAGQYDEAYELFTSFEQEYGVKPDVATVSIMLDAARYASAAAGKGFGPGFEDLSSLSMGGGGGGVREQGRLEEERERSKFGLVVDDRWDGVPAARRIERFVWTDVLGANWQDADVQDPLYASSSSGGGGLTSWLANKFHHSPSSTTAAKSDSSPSTLSPPPDWHPFASTLSPSPPLYPHFAPSDRLFRSLIQLTGYHSDARSIPLILAWMKHAHVVPSRWTLALAIMYVEGEAGIQAKRVAVWKRWLGEWLGEEAVPRDGEIAWVRRGGRRAGVPELR